ncbi:substrate-binding domain-containing protein, partial [Paraburkholderia sp. BR10879]
IIGFDDIELGNFTWPALSTVGQPARALGDMAALTLIERIANAREEGARARRRVMPPTLFARESTGPWVGAEEYAPLAA